MTSPRTRRLFASAAAFALAVTGVAISAPSAEAAPAPRTYTAVMTPATATPGVSTAYSVVVKNTSTKISALDRFILTIPSGFSVTGSAATTRTGWTGSVSATEVKVSTSKPLKYGLLKGQSLTMTFNATYLTECGTTPVTWVPKADGAIIDPWKYQSGPPSNTTVTPTPVANRFVVTAVTPDESIQLGNQVLKDQPFDVTGTFNCNDVAAKTPAPASTVTLSSSDPQFGGNLTANVAAGSSSATVTGATYSGVKNGVAVTATWSGAADAFNVDVLDAATSSNGDPGTLTIEGAAAADLPAGANGPVSLVVQQCSGPDANFCTNGTEIELKGDFKDLYSAAAPASVSRICSPTDCPHLSLLGNEEGEGGASYNYNFDCYLGCAGYGTLYGEREVEEDFENYPTFVSINGLAFAQAPRCVPVDDLVTTGKIQTTESESEATVAFCVDVNAITRGSGPPFDWDAEDGQGEGTVAQSFWGELTIPVLFVEDIKLRP